MVQKESDTGVVIGVLLMLGSIVSYLPQYYKIIKNKNVNGISHWSQGLNNISCFCAFFGAFMFDYHIFRDCPKDKYCNRDLIPFFQLLFVWLCPLINYVIFIKYYHCPSYKKSKVYYCPSFKKSNTHFIEIESRYFVYGFFWFYVLIFLGCCLMTSIVLVGNWKNWKNHGLLFGKILNSLSSLITAFVWIPQIYKTVKEKTVGSLSLLSLAIQAPGTFMIFIFQVVISHSSWFIGLPYLITSIFQTAIFGFGYYYERKRIIDADKLFALYDGDINYEYESDNELLNTPIYPDYDTL